MFPPIDSEQIDIDLLSNFNGSEDLDSLDECESESDSVKTQNYLEDYIYRNDLSSRAHETLKYLVQNNAYHSKKRLCYLWELKGYQSLEDEIITYIRSFPERIYTNETRLKGYYLNEINTSMHKTVLNSFIPVETRS
jgi:hypothetical protein